MDSTTSEHREWWTVFNDPRLTRLIQLAYQQNLTLQTAGVRVLEPAHAWASLLASSIRSNSSSARRSLIIGSLSRYPTT